MRLDRVGAFILGCAVGALGTLRPHLATGASTMTDHVPIIPEDITDPVPGYAPGHWNYPLRCADVEAALSYACERAGEWDMTADAHGWWHERPAWIALHNEVLRLRALLPPARGCEPYANGKGWWHVPGCEHVNWSDEVPRA